MYTKSILNILSRIAVLVLSLITMFVVISCDAPRNNPLDPENPDVKKGIISGYIKSEAIPHLAISNALIKWNNDYLGETDINGYFEFVVEYSSSIKLIFEKIGFNSDSLEIEMGENNQSIEVFLNQYPNLDSLSVYSIVISRYSLPPTVQLVVTAKISDSDKDIDSVYVINDEFGINEHLAYNSNSKLYSKEIYSYNLNLSSLEEMVGKYIKIIVKDSKNRTFEAGKGLLARVINSPIEHSSPSNYDTVSNKPKIEWFTYEPNFSCTFTVEVYSYEVDFSTVLVWSKEYLSSSLTSISVDKELPEGNYFWVIWCVDSYSNRIRSNPASFYIKN